MERGKSDRHWHPLWAGAGLGTAASVLAALAAGLASSDLYTDWRSLAGSLIMIPLFAVAAAASVVVPLAALRRIGWIVLPTAMLAAVISGGNSALVAFSDERCAQLLSR